MDSLHDHVQIAHRNLLFAGLGLEKEWLNLHQVHEAYRIWSLDKTGHLGDILVQMHCLTAEKKSLLDLEVDQRLASASRIEPTYDSQSILEKIQQSFDNQKNPLLSSEVPLELLQELEAALHHGSLSSEPPAFAEPIAPAGLQAQCDPDHPTVSEAIRLEPEFSPFAGTNPGPGPGAGGGAGIGQRAGAGAATPSSANDIVSGELLWIGRYQIERLLGKGGFGFVYLGFDEQLRRQVAIKIPHPRLVEKNTDAQVYLNEARTVAGLDHPHIVPVYDVGSTDQLPCFVVSKYIDGTDLSARLKRSQLSIIEAVNLAATIAEALHYAHKKGLVHRDIKPSNILLDQTGKPFIADFGLALKERDLGKGPRYAGTPAYMSPEQARGEGHRVDGRSDIFSLGVVLYEVLVGKRPFKADSKGELYEQIAKLEARPPRQVNDNIPKELDRICLKALAKRASDRYSTAKDMAEDLRHFLATASLEDQAKLTVFNKAEIEPQSSGQATSPTSQETQPLKIVPKGLRSFDAADADFFLELLPGPRDRDGLPDSIRFWKNRIENEKGEEVFSVGLVYGPSGCGKSSLIKAGLLPRLAKSIIPVYIEATPEETESRLIKGLRRQLPKLPDRYSLTDALTALRQGQFLDGNQKVLLVLDQFEQWLHTHRKEENAEPCDLVQALRQCDGGKIQCICLVRDDFWLAVSRFMFDLEILVEGENSRLVDLFPPRHAEKVLTAIGRAFGELPAKSSEMTREQNQFVQKSMADLAQEGKVVSVRLALFAEMMKHRKWTPASLEQVGGVQGLTVTFLEETFSGPTALPGHRLHQKAARGVLFELLPVSGSDIKGRMRSHDELQQASGYAQNDRDFSGLLRILDRDLRLITPTDPEGQDAAGPIESASAVTPNSSSENGRGAETSPTRQRLDKGYYQLAHDYLVPGIRDWLRKKQKETVQGRTEILLEERAALWETTKQNRHLPDLYEFLQLSFHLKKSQHSSSQEEMMKNSRAYYGLRLAAALAVFALIAFGAFALYERGKAHALVGQLAKADPAQIPALAREIGGYAYFADPLLQKMIREEPDSPAALSAQIALLERHPDLAQTLAIQLPHLSNERFEIVRTALVPFKDLIVQDLRQAVFATQTPSQRLRLAGALALLDAEGPEWEKLPEFAATYLCMQDTTNFLFWRKALSPVAGPMIPLLEAEFRNQKASEQARAFAAEAVIEYARDQPATLFNMLADAPPHFYPNLLQACLVHTGMCAALAQREADTPIPSELPERDKDALAQRKANAAVFLLHAGQGDAVWPLLQQTPDPRIRSEIVHLGPQVHLPPRILLDRLDEENDISSKRALVLALGVYPLTQIPENRRASLIARLARDFQEHPDQGYHASLEWTLRRWGQAQAVEEALGALRGRMPATTSANSGWLVSPTGLVLVRVPSGSFTMGSPQNESGRGRNEKQVKRTILQPFFLASHEVTAELFKQFETEIGRVEYSKPEQFSSIPKPGQSPQLRVDWYDAARFCNWLSEREKIPRDQWCYEPVKVTDLQSDKTGGYKEGMAIKENHRKLAGYRLPSEVEWEYACRAGTTTSRYFGNRLGLLSHYSWHNENSDHQVWPVHLLKPNDWGLFGMNGNANEWCQDNYDRGEKPDPDRLPYWDPTGVEPGEVIVTKNRRVCRGGSFYDPPQSSRSADRDTYRPDNRLITFGFRPARTDIHETIHDGQKRTPISRP